MTKSEFNDEYFDWMYNLVIPKDYTTHGRSYSKTLRYLHEIPFKYIIAMDANREADGIDLRYKFGYECGHSDIMIAHYLDNKQCSVLEMMVALSLRMEESIMTNPEIGDRTHVWFWDMLKSMDLNHIYNSIYSKWEVERAVSKMLDRSYCRNGAGGLFTLHTHKRYDMRTIELWQQAMWYLNEVEDGING